MDKSVGIGDGDLKSVGEITRKIWLRIFHDIKNLWMVFIAVAVYAIFMNIVFHAFCPLVALSGFPCPGCGMTRAMFFLVTGRLGQAVWMNPMSVPVACLILYFLWNRYILGKKAKGIVPLTWIAAFLLVIVYVWRMCLLFPNRIPYVYTEYNALTKIFPFYEQILHEWKII